MTDADYMARALFHAARGRGRTSPNPMVGAVIVSPDGIVVGEGYHARAGGPHAEVNALSIAGDRARGATLYCSLEPCCHIGRTGPCVARIADAGIARVVAPLEDPNPLVCGRGFQFLREHGIAVDVGIGRGEAERLNQPFFTLMSKHRPFVTLKAAISADGGLSATPGEQTWLTSPAADRHGHRIRAEIDAIAVGAGTILADDPLLTARGAYRARPLTRVIFDRRLRTPPGARVLSTLAAGPVIIMTGADGARDRAARLALETAGAEIVVTDGTIAAALHVLAERGLSDLLIEGGAVLHAAAWAEQVVDYVRLYVTPHHLGPGSLKFLDAAQLSADHLVDVHRRTLGPDILVEGYVHGPR